MYLLVPDSHRIDATFERIHRALQNTVQALLNCRVNLGVLNETKEDLTEIPSAGKAMFWILPCRPTGETFRTVLYWVKQGGTLYLSGPIGFDRTCQPVRSERFQLLGLPDQPALLPFEKGQKEWVTQPVIRDTNRGKVVYVPSPVELVPSGWLGQIYRHVLQLAGVDFTDFTVYFSTASCSNPLQASPRRPENLHSELVHEE